MYLFDTNVLSEITKRQPNQPVLRKFFSCAGALRFASDMTRYEMRYGAALLPPGNTLWAQFEADVVTRCTWLPVDVEVCLRAADLNAQLRQAGLTTDLADVFIAATALVHDFVMVTRNVRHFNRVPGLQVENWFPAG